MRATSGSPFATKHFWIQSKTAYAHACLGRWVGRPSGQSSRVGRVLTKVVVLRPQTMQSPSHYSAVFQREAAKLYESSLAWSDSGEEEDEEKGKKKEKETLCMLLSHSAQST